MAEKLSDGVKKCVAILKGATNDTEKFAALFMVTKLVKASDCNTSCKKALFEAIGFSFLRRLLLSEDVPEDCPPMVYKSIACAVLSSFCRDPDIAAHRDMVANLPTFLQIVSQADDDDLDDNLLVVSEAYECLACIAATPSGGQALLDQGAVAKLSEIYAQQSFQTDEALNILVGLVKRFGERAWVNDHKPLHAVLNKIAFDFHTDSSDRKFTLCSVLAALVSNAPDGFDASEETWPLTVYKALAEILTSRLGKTQRDPALTLAAAMLTQLGVAWSLQDEEKPRQFFLLLVHLCSIEVRMQLEDRSLVQIGSNALLVTACFSVLEQALAFIALDTMDLEQKEKQQLYTALKGAFAAVLALLAKIAKSGEVALDNQPFLYATVRVLTAWMSQETAAMRTAVHTVLPFVLSTCNATFRTRRDDPNAPPDLLRLLLPSLCHLVVDEDARRLILAAKEEAVLFECLQAHWKTRATDPNSPAALTSLCNIFMNLTVLEAALVESNPLFPNLLKFLLNSLPELTNSAENLLLHGNVAVLGLLLLKQLSKRVKKNDYSICRFVQATIRFLWDAYEVDNGALMVALAYKEHWDQLMELWFLGMQTMSAVLALVPWISEFAMESGWAEGVMDSLRTVHKGALPANTKSAYEDFLCRLVDANKSVVATLKKHDALAVCRTHRFMELGKRLFGD